MNDMTDYKKMYKDSKPKAVYGLSKTVALVLFDTAEEDDGYYDYMVARTSEEGYTDFEPVIVEWIDADEMYIITYKDTIYPLDLFMKL